MRDYIPIHGIDYLNDYYAILGVPRDAASEEIKSAYREKMKGYHPDRVSRAGEDIRAEAERKSKLITEAFGILSDEIKRSDYDVKLQSFDPRHVSAEGIPLLDLFSRRIDVDFLISGKSWDSKDAIIAEAKQRSGYNEVMFDFIEKQYNVAERPSPEVRQLYKQVLTQKNAFLSFVESVAWEDAGVSNQVDSKFIFYPDQHVDFRLNQIEDVKQKIVGAVDERILALTGGSNPLLLPSGKALMPGDVENYGAELRGELLKSAVGRFESREDEIKQWSEQRADVLEKLVNLTDWEYYPKQGKFFNKLLVLPVREEAIVLGFLYDLSQAQVSPSIFEGFLGMPLQEFKSDGMLGQLTALIENETNIALLHSNKELDIMLENGFVLSEHSERLGC